MSFGEVRQRGGGRKRVSPPLQFLSVILVECLEFLLQTKKIYRTISIKPALRWRIRKKNIYKKIHPSGLNSRLDLSTGQIMHLAIIRLKHVTVCLNNAKHIVTPNQCSVYDSNKQLIFSSTAGSQFLSGGLWNKINMAILVWSSR